MKSARITTRALLGLGLSLLLLYPLAGGAHSQRRHDNDKKGKDTAGREPAVLSFDRCVVDDDSRLNIQFNTTTGAFSFTDCGSVTVTGTGTVKIKGCKVTLVQIGGSQKVEIAFDGCVNKARASVITLVPARSFLLSDRNTANDVCSCM